MRKAVIRTGRPDTEPIAIAFAKGAGMEIITPEEFKRSPREFSDVAMFGYLRGCGECMKMAESFGVDYWYIDHAYLDPWRDAKSVEDRAFFRVTKNAWQNYRHTERPSDRYEKYFTHIQPKPWLRGARLIMVVGLSDFMKNFWNLATWDRDIRRVIHRQIRTRDLKIFFRPKPPSRRIKGHAKMDWLPIYGTVVYANSVMGVESILNGVPAFPHENNVCYPFSNGYDITNPWREDRQQFLNHLSYSQFSIAEMKSGEAWSILND